MRKLIAMLSKMTRLTDDDFSKIPFEQRDFLPVDKSMGTGFLVMLKDSRVTPPAGSGPNTVSGFQYLVTNRHVVQPGIENGNPCRIVHRFVILNRREPATAETISVDRLVWHFPDDDSVDLAITPIGFPQGLFDSIVLTTDQFITTEEIEKRKVVEGDPVMFTGLFIQTYEDGHRLEPIVRSGTLAMIPEGQLQTTMNHRLGTIYLAEAHAFHGNSGSPVFLDSSKFQNILTFPSYRLLGLISGEVTESADLTLNVTTSLGAVIGANSDISVVVPATEILKLLKSSSLTDQREAQMKH